MHVTMPYVWYLRAAVNVMTLLASLISGPRGPRFLERGLATLQWGGNKVRNGLRSANAAPRSLLILGALLETRTNSAEVDLRSHVEWLERLTRDTAISG